MWKTIRKTILVLLVVGLLTMPGMPWAEEEAGVKKLALSKAVMCETIQEYAPVNTAVVFSIERGRVSCFTEFDPVPEKTYVYHRWYRRDGLITVKRLTINPPRWSSFTSVQLRDADKGPWRVEITDADNTLLHTLRFSITD